MNTPSIQNSVFLYSVLSLFIALSVSTSPGTISLSLSLKLNNVFLSIFLFLCSLFFPPFLYLSFFFSLPFFFSYLCLPLSLLPVTRRVTMIKTQMMSPVKGLGITFIVRYTSMTKYYCSQRHYKTLKYLGF